MVLNKDKKYKKEHKPVKKLFFITTFIFVFGLSLPISSFAQGMPVLSAVEWMGNTVITSDDHTAREEAEGKGVWKKLQAKQISCADLSDENFGTLGEYFMGTMMDDSHAAMNVMMIQMHGEEWEEQIHIVMGKRLSGCDTSVAFPGGNGSWMPVNMMWGGPAAWGVVNWSSPFGNNSTNNMMNFGFGPFGGFGWIFMILWWVLIIAGVVALLKWLMTQSHGSHNHEKSPLEILKERYARGEIDKKEFEEKKRDLN